MRLSQWISGMRVREGKRRQGHYQKTYSTQCVGIAGKFQIQERKAKDLREGKSVEIETEPRLEEQQMMQKLRKSNDESLVRRVTNDERVVKKTQIDGVEAKIKRK